MGNTVRIRNGMSNATEGDILGSASDIIKDLGVVDLAGGHLLVTQNSPLGMSVQVAGGVVYVPNSNYSILDSDTPKFYPVVCSNEVLAVDNNVSGSTRYDIVCVKIDKVIVPDPDASNVATKVVIKGTPGAGVPATPANHYKLAEIKVVNGETEITNAEITDKRTQITLDIAKLPDIKSKNTFIPREMKTIDTTTYDAFGILVKIDEDNAIYFFRQGSSHVGDKGKIVAQKYTFSTTKWGLRWTIYEDTNTNYDVRNVAGGIIGNKIYLFFTRYNISTSKLQDMGYIVSTDLTGALWSGYTAINTGFYWGSPYGALIDTNTSGKYLVPIYGDNGSGTYYIKFFETEDSGDTWHIGDTIYSGASSFTETSVAHLGNGKMIALLRINTGGYVYQSISSNNGVTWSAPIITNMGEPTGIKIPWIYYIESSNTIVALYQDRFGQKPMRIYIANATTVFNDNLKWEHVRDSSLDLEKSSDEGYCSMVAITDKLLLYVFYRGTSSDVDTYTGILELKPVEDKMFPNGWYETFEVWTRISDISFTTPTDKTSKYDYGYKIRWYQQGWKYAYIVGMSYSSETDLTTIKIAGDSMISSTTVYSPGWSNIENPKGFPNYFAYTSDVFAGSGTLGSATITANFKIDKKTVEVNLFIQIITNGTGAVTLYAKTPTHLPAVGENGVFYGREFAISGKMVQGLINGISGIPPVTDILIRDYANLYPGGDGYKINLTGKYRYA